MSFLDKIFGYADKKVVSQLGSKVDEINSFEPVLQKLTDKELKNKTEEFRKKLLEAKGDYNKEDKIKEEILPEAFAVMREAMKRVWGERHFDVQLMGGIVLHQGKIAEMKTGEGKTIVAALSLYLNALSSRGVHLVTVNDYLARLNGEGMGEAYNFLGLSTGIIQNNQESHRFVKKKDYKHYSECDGSNLESCSRTEAYACDITYGTNNEFGFDYLRDNMAPALQHCVQRSLHYAIVDEVDSILIDEARTPLIISAPAEESASLYQQFAGLIPKLKSEDDYIIDEKDRVATLTDAGIKKMEQLLGVQNIYEAGGISMVHHLEQALKAHTLFKKDKDYIVKDGEIVIVDEFTGRLMVGRRYSEGLHQAIEAKEGVEVKQESQTMATISFQNLFRLYKKLAGMTGTAATEAEEFYKIYKLDVVEIPTNKSVTRQDLPDRIYKNEVGKLKAIVDEVRGLQEKGQPVLVGTVSVQKNELISKMFKRAGIKHEVLNAKNHEREAKIVMKAGQKGAVTVATNMAGRGTDIKLGEGVVELGGLFVLGTERHESRRIDNQLRGRAGRQGDQGASQFYVSMDDDLMRIFGGDRMKNLMNTLGLPEDMPIENKMISRSIESSQRRVEGHNFDIRKHLVEYDDVMNKHREVIYRKRRKILEGNLVEDERQSPSPSVISTPRDSSRAEKSPVKDPSTLVGMTSNIEEPLTIKDEILGIIDDEIDAIVNLNPPAGGEDKEKAKIELGTLLGESNVPASLDIEETKKAARKLYKEREERFGPEVMRNVERAVYLRTIDMLWVEHLTTMDELRTGIGLRGYGQRDPLVEYKQEAYRLFQSLLGNIESSVARMIFKVEVQMPAVTTVRRKPLEYKAPDPDAIGAIEQEKSETRKSRPEADQPIAENDQNNTNVTTTIRQKGKSVYEKMGEYQTGPKSQVKNGDKVGRNDLCPCGSGKKYKKCCGK